VNRVFVNKKMKITYQVALFCFMLVFSSSCSELIEYSPYDTDVDQLECNLTNVDKIAINSIVDDTLKFALFSDSHFYYDDLEDVVKLINKQNDIKFVVSCGDLTESGLSQEYVWYNDIVKKLKYPLISLIGNHDYRSNGVANYKRLYGPTNMTFKCGKYKFIVFDDVVWENNNQSPRFDWLEAELNNSDGTEYSVLFSHIPPWTDQLEGSYNVMFEDLLLESNVILNFFGHVHTYSQGVYANIPSYTATTIEDDEYYIVKLVGNKSFVERVKF
jgi:Icc protein